MVICKKDKTSDQRTEGFHVHHLAKPYQCLDTKRGKKDRKVFVLRKKTSSLTLNTLEDGKTRSQGNHCSNG